MARIPVDQGIPQEVLGMDAQAILEIRPALTEYLHEFDGCFANVRSQRHLATYVGGQLSDLHRKSIEPMADAAGVSPRTLQECLSLPVRMRVRPVTVCNVGWHGGTAIRTASGSSTRRAT